MRHVCVKMFSSRAMQVTICLLEDHFYENSCVKLAKFQSAYKLLYYSYLFLILHKKHVFFVNLTSIINKFMFYLLQNLPSQQRILSIKCLTYFQNSDESHGFQV